MSRALIPTLLACALLAGGCADSSERRPRAEQSRQEPTRTTPPVSPSPSATATATGEATGGAKATKPRRGTPKIAPSLPMARSGGTRAHLLGADILPRAGAKAAWTVRGTGAEGSRRVGACQATSLVDIGAMHAVIRVFRGPDGSGVRSRQIVARLVDTKSAWRTHQVLRSWRSDCEERLDHATVKVGPMEAVELDAGTGEHYRATYGPKKDANHSGLGIVRSGRWLSIVEITATEGGVPRGWARRAVRRIAATF